MPGTSERAQQCKYIFKSSPERNHLQSLPIMKAPDLSSAVIWLRFLHSWKPALGTSEPCEIPGLGTALTDVP